LGGQVGQGWTRHQTQWGRGALSGQTVDGGGGEPAEGGGAALPDDVVNTQKERGPGLGVRGWAGPWGREATRVGWAGAVRGEWGGDRAGGAAQMGRQG